jgi:hypothetical protein
MKSYIYYLLALGFFLTACKKDVDPAFDKSPDQRLTETLAAYQQQLVNAPNGWKAYVYPTGVGVAPSDIGGFTFYMKFTNANRVSMMSDFDNTTSTVARESSYRLKALQQPTLIFDTYSYIHTIADPDPNVSFGWYGRGWASDFELAYKNVKQDTIEFEGRLNKSKVFFIKATQAEEDAFKAGQLKKIVDASIAYITANKFLYFNGTANTRIAVAFDYNFLIVKFTYIDPASGAVVTINAPFSHTLNGVHLKEPVSMSGFTFQDMYWDEVKSIYYIMAGTARVELINAAAPIIPLWNVLGINYTSITVPVTPLPGQSALFATKYAAVKTGVKTGGFNLDLGEMSFTFNVPNKTMVLSAPMKQGATTFAFIWNFSYTVDNNGIFKFTRTGQNANAPVVETPMRALLDYIENDKFSIDFFVNGATLLGQFNSKDNPAFSFTGNLK